jgi:hypothetical protein
MLHVITENDLQTRTAPARQLAHWHARNRRLFRVMSGPAVAILMARRAGLLIRCP